MEKITEKEARRDREIKNSIIKSVKDIWVQKDGSLLFYDTPDNKTHFFKLDEKYVIDTRHEITEEEYLSLGGSWSSDFYDTQNYMKIR